MHDGAYACWQAESQYPCVNEASMLSVMQAGNSLHRPVQAAQGPPLPPSPVYKASCEHFTWPLLEPQVRYSITKLSALVLHSHMGIFGAVQAAAQYMPL